MPYLPHQPAPDVPGDVREASAAAVHAELAEVVATAAQLDPAQARIVATAMLRHLAARLPSPLFGEMQSCLSRSMPAR